MGKILFFLFHFVFFATNLAFAQDGVLITPGHVGFNFKIATNYQIFRSPWEFPIDYPRIDVNTSLPIMVNRWEPNLSGLLPEETFGMNPSFAPTISTGFQPSTSIQVSMPFMYDRVKEATGFRGAISGGYAKNIDMILDLSVKNLKIDKFIRPADDIPLRFRALIDAPFYYYMRWNSFFVNYTLSPSRHMYISLQMTNHNFELHTDNYVNIDFRGYAEINDLRVPIEYNLPDKQGDEVYSWAQGNYSGGRWLPVLGVKVPFVSFVMRFGGTVDLRGSYSMGYSLPFFIIPDSIPAAAGGGEGMQDSAFIDWNALISNPARIGNSETVSRAYTTEEVSYGTIPSNFTLGVDIIPRHLNLSWTYFFDSFVLEHTDGELSWFYTDGEREQARIGRQNFYLNVDISHILLLNASYKYYSLSLGVMDFGLSIRQNEQTLSRVFLPVLGAGVRTMTQYELYLNGFLSPIPSIRGGFRIHLN